MSEPTISYPRNFLERPEDRAFLISFRGQEAKPAQVKFHLYRMWADFATGGGDTRLVSSGTECLSSDPAALMIEEFCQWEGDPGDLVSRCLKSGFLSYEPRESGGGVLRCTGFMQANQASFGKLGSMQKAGGHARGRQRQKAAAERETKEMLELWKRNGTESPDGMTAPQAEQSVLFILRVCRAMNWKKPSMDEMRSGSMRMAGEILVKSSSERLEKVVLWLIANRNAMDMPTRLDQLLRVWDGIEKRALED